MMRIGQAGGWGSSVLCVIAILCSLAPAQERVECRSADQRDCVQRPEIRKQVAPKYSKKARETGIEGKVVLLCTVGVDGRAHDIKVAHSLDRELDENAVNALKKYRFRPATINGKAVPYDISIETRFSLPEGS